MSVKINIPSYLHSYLDSSNDNVEAVEVSASTVGGCLKQLVKRFPSIKKMLFARNGDLLNYIGIYVNREDAYPGELAKALKDGDELHIIYMVDGG